MELFNCLFGVVVVVVVLACDVTAQLPWMLPVQKHQPPHPSQLPPQQPKVPPPAAPFDKCQVDGGERIQCGPQDITAERCENINCCFDGWQCYYGKAVTVQCTRDGQFVVVVARAATVPHIDVDSVSLLETNDPSCTPVDFTSAFAIFQFPVTACGTTFKEEEGYVVYENHMSSSYEVGLGPRGAITRDSHFELLFQCRYSATAVEALVMEVNSVPPPVPVAAMGLLRVALKIGNGQCHSKGCVEEEAAYSSFYTPDDYPITKVLREPVYVEVNILERSDPNIILNLEHCWATSTPSPNSLPQWDLLVDGCPYQDDRYLTTVVPVGGSSGLPYPTHYKRFIVKMFTFVDQNTYSTNKDSVYIHCATAVCYPSSTNSCEQPCHRQRRAAVRKSSSNQQTLVSSGEVIMTEQKTPSTNIKSR
ncbi:Zona pellucida sperm-binding protein 4 Zona pellucida glycoprotein 4 [Larimichthys crocea]|uniref:Zona pellucida sperm-binding protein 4 n=1 Tax=Larimichthys crocea TaxID=215358 RepID=A0A6G0IHK1_LARCR|nr:Zona pellucida sperm-binding protein 4 Zona pellucida glycoprotein 4 [Larimichthys crocea]